MEEPVVVNLEAEHGRCASPACWLGVGLAEWGKAWAGRRRVGPVPAQRSGSGHAAGGGAPRSTPPPGAPRPLAPPHVGWGPPDPFFPVPAARVEDPEVPSLSSLLEPHRAVDPAQGLSAEDAAAEVERLRREAPPAQGEPF